MISEILKKAAEAGNYHFLRDEPTKPAPEPAKGKAPVQSVVDFIPKGLQAVGDQRVKAASNARRSALQAPLPDTQMVPDDKTLLISALLGAGANAINPKEQAGTLALQNFLGGFAGARGQIQQRKLQERQDNIALADINAQEHLTLAQQDYRRSDEFLKAQEKARDDAEAKRRFEIQMAQKIGADKVRIITDIIGSKPRNEADIDLAVTSAKAGGIDFTPEDVAVLKKGVRDSIAESRAFESYKQDRQAMRSADMEIRASALPSLKATLQAYPQFVGADSADIPELMKQTEGYVTTRTIREKLNLEKINSEIEDRNYKKASTLLTQARTRLTQLNADEQAIINRFLPRSLQAKMEVDRTAAIENLAQAEKAKRLPTEGSLTPNALQDNLRQAQDRKTKARTTSQTLTAQNTVYEKAIADLANGKYPLPSGVTAERLRRQMEEQIELNKAIIAANDQTIADQDTYITDLRDMAKAPAKPDAAALRKKYGY